MSQAARPDPRALPTAPTTRFAPAPTGHLHLGHLANAAYVWGVARASGGTVILRIEDHDRQRSRAAFERDLLDDLDGLGLRPDRPSTDEIRSGPSAYRQSDRGPWYAAALERLRERGLSYACDCTRATFAAWADEHGTAFGGSAQVAFICEPLLIEGEHVGDHGPRIEQRERRVARFARGERFQLEEFRG